MNSEQTQEVASQLQQPDPMQALPPVQPASASKESVDEFCPPPLVSCASDAHIDKSPQFDGSGINAPEDTSAEQSMEGVEQSQPDSSNSGSAPSAYGPVRRRVTGKDEQASCHATRRFR